MEPNKSFIGAFSFIPNFRPIFYTDQSLHNHTSIYVKTDDVDVNSNAVQSHFVENICNERDEHL